jgi:hypothetical protein
MNQFLLPSSSSHWLPLIHIPAGGCHHGCRRRDELGKPEVRQLDGRVVRARLEQDVLRLEVAVGDALAVGVLQGKVLCALVVRRGHATAHLNTGSQLPQ